MLGSAESVFAYAATAAFALALVLAVVAQRSASAMKLGLCAGVFFVGLLATVALRDALRRIALAEHLKLSDVPVHSQWSSFVLFAIVFVLGLALVAWMVRAAYRPAPGGIPAEPNAG